MSWMEIQSPWKIFDEFLINKFLFNSIKNAFYFAQQQPSKLMLLPENVSGLPKIETEL